MLDRKEDKLFLTIEKISEAVVLVDDRGGILQVSPGFKALSGWAEQELVGRSLGYLVGESRDDEAADPSMVAAPSASVIQLTAGNHRYRRRDGGYFWAETSTLTMRRDDGRVHGCLYIVSDVSDRIQRAENLMELVAFAAEHGGHDEIDSLAKAPGYQSRADLLSGSEGSHRADDQRPGQWRAVVQHWR